MTYVTASTASSSCLYLFCDFCHCSGFVCFVPFGDFRKSKNPAKAKGLLWPRPGNHKFCSNLRRRRCNCQVLLKSRVGRVGPVSYPRRRPRFFCSNSCPDSPSLSGRSIPLLNGACFCTRSWGSSRLCHWFGIPQHIGRNIGIRPFPTCCCSAM